MCRVITLTGCSASGKDSILKDVLLRSEVRPIISTTSRPIRKGEVDGREYNFITYGEALERLYFKEFIETRFYEVANGDTWIYGIEKSQIDLKSDEVYIAIVDFQGLKELEKYVGRDNVFSIYLDTSLQERLRRSISREGLMSDEQCLEVCRRMIADSKEVVPAKEYCNICLRNEKGSDAIDCADYIKLLIRSVR